MTITKVEVVAFETNNETEEKQLSFCLNKTGSPKKYSSVHILCAPKA